MHLNAPGIRRLLALLILPAGFAMATASRAQSAHGDSAHGVETQAVQLFAQACLQHYPDADDFQAWTQHQHFAAATPALTHRLTGRRGGQGFVVKLGTHDILLIAEKGNLCSVYVRRADTAAARRALAPLREGLREPGNLRERADTQRRDTPDGRVDIRQWTYIRQDGQPALVLTLSTSRSTQGLYQMALSASMNRRGRSGGASSSPP